MMIKKSNLINSKRKMLLFLVIAVLTFGIVTPVLAAYLGPLNRTTESTKVETYDYGVWAKDDPGYPSNPICNHKGGGTDCIVCTWDHKPGNPCGDAEYWYQLGTKTEEVTTTINLPPATISSTLQTCALNNGWCNTSAKLFLSGTEPVSGYSITAIEGTLNGQVFNCSGANCSVPLNEGNNNFTFWALSSFGDSSTLGTFTAKVDTVSPNVSMSVSGSSGANGWYVSQAIVSASASDATSGISTLLISDNGGAGKSSPVTLNNGVHNLIITAIDKAGNSKSISQTVKVDTSDPIITPSLIGTPGTNGWYISMVNVSAFVSDLVSGLQGNVEVSFDNGTSWETPPVQLTDGLHSIIFRAYDNAGNMGTASINASIDTTSPIMNFVLTGTPGSNGWYVSDVNVSASASDVLSDVDKVEVSADGCGWSFSVMLSDGAHTLDGYAIDKAGNIKTISDALRIDTSVPSSNYTSHTDNSLVSGVAQLAGLASDSNSLQFVEISLDGGATWQATTLSSSGWSYDWNTATIPNGTYTVQIRATDVAGNQENPVPLSLVVDNLPPHVKITDFWWIWQSGEFHVSPNTFAVGEITVKISDPQNRWSPVRFTYNPEKTSSTVTWDRRFPGGVIAPMGNYWAEITACDVYGNCASDKGQIKIPILAPIPSTATPTAATIPSPVSTITTLVPTGIVVATPSGTPMPVQVISEPSTPKKPNLISRPHWVVLILTLLVLLFGFLTVLDPRPRALLSLAQAIHQFNRSK